MNAVERPLLEQQFGLKDRDGGPAGAGGDSNLPGRDDAHPANSSDDSTARESFMRTAAATVPAPCASLYPGCAAPRWWSRSYELAGAGRHRVERLANASSLARDGGPSEQLRTTEAPRRGSPRRSRRLEVGQGLMVRNMCMDGLGILEGIMEPSRRRPTIVRRRDEGVVRTPPAHRPGESAVATSPKPTPSVARQIRSRSSSKPTK